MPRVGIAVVVAAAVAGCGPGASEREACGYRCGPAGECPDGFACYADSRCHREGSPESFGCTLDGGPDIAPTIVSSVPESNASGVPSNVMIALVFSESVSGVDEGTFILRQRSVFEPLPTDVIYTDYDHTARLRPLDPLADGTAYVATIEPTVIDATGHPITGFSWEFATQADITPPTIRIVAPAYGAVDVGVDAKVVVEFSEPVIGTTPSSLLLVGPSGTAITTLAYAGQTGLRIIPMTQLEPHSTYTMTATSAISDFAGNPLAGAPIVFATFTTGGDTVPPTILQTVPTMEFSSVSPSTFVDVLFSEPMTGLSPATFTLDKDGVSVPATVSYRNGTRAIRLVPSAPLDIGATYRVRIWPALTDLAGNPVTPGVLGWTFTTWGSP